jgi:hypothetical protein
MSAKKHASDATPADPNSLQVSDVGFYDDGKNLIVEIKLRNSSSTRTLHAYATARNLHYDAATRTLTVLLSDRLTEDVQGSIFVHPRFVPVDPGGETTVRLRLPRFLTRMVPGQNMPAPKLEKIPIHEATSIQVEVDWSDTPFYADPRAQRTPPQQLVHWTKSTARKKGNRREAPGRSQQK